MLIKDLAGQILRDHASKPTALFYDINPLGSMFGKAEVALLDSTYAELVAAGLMEASGSFVSFFGEPKRAFRVTSLGIQQVQASGPELS